MVSKFRQIGGAKSYRGWALWAEGEYIQGKFTGTAVDNYGKTSWHIEIDETNVEYDENHHYVNQFGKKVFDTEIVVGEVLSLNSNGSLDFKMETVAQGETVQIAYNGKKLLKKGAFKGKEFHDISVSVAEDDSVETEGATESFTQL